MISGRRPTGADGAPARVDEPPLSAEEARERAADRDWTAEPFGDDAAQADDAAPAPVASAPQAEPLRPASTARILPTDWRSAWIVLATAAAMGFLAALFLALDAAVDRLAGGWTTALQQRATLLVDAAPGADGAAALSSAVATAREVRGVLAADPVPREASAAIMAPYFGPDGAEAFGIHLIDLTLAAPADTAPGRAILEGLDAALRAAGVRAEIDSHAPQAARLSGAAESVQALAAFALTVIAVACALLTVLACHTALAAQAHVVDVLRMIGARDGFITRLFVRRLQFLTLIGGAVGAAAAALALALGPGAATAAEPGALAPLLPELSLNFETALRFALAPLALALIATLAAWASVALRLRRIER